MKIRRSSTMALMDSGLCRRRMSSQSMLCPAIVCGLFVCNAAAWVSIQTRTKPRKAPFKPLPRHEASSSSAAHFFPSSFSTTTTQISNFRVDGEYSRNNKKQRRRSRKPWHRGVTKFLRRRKSDSDASDDETKTHHAPSRMQMSLQTEQEIIETDEPLSPYFSDGFQGSNILQNDTTAFLRDVFTSLSPQDLFRDQDLASSQALKIVEDFPVSQTTDTAHSDTQRPFSQDSDRIPIFSPWIRKHVDSALKVSQTKSTSSDNIDRTRARIRNKFWTRLTQKWFQNFLLGVIERRSTVAPHGLVVEAHPRGRFGGLASFHNNGQFRCDTTIHFDRVVFPNIRLSGGGKLMTKRLLVNLLAFGKTNWSAAPRYARPFDVIATNCTLTEDDLWESSCIRNGLANLLVCILNNVGVSTVKVKVTSVKILPSNKISCSGEATSDFGSTVPFEVRSGLDTASRGHRLTFPGLEVSLNPILGFMPVLPEIDLDIGHNARLLHAELDGRRRRITVSATTTVTPHHTRRLKNYVQHSDSYLAQFSFDVGEWVTKIGRFAN